MHLCLSPCIYTYTIHTHLALDFQIFFYHGTNPTSLSFLNERRKSHSSGVTVPPGDPDLQGAEEAFQGLSLQLLLYVCLQVLLGNRLHQLGRHAGGDAVVKLNVGEEKVNLREQMIS